jgi:hypothetical protein
MTGWMEALWSLAGLLMIQFALQSAFVDGSGLEASCVVASPVSSRGTKGGWTGRSALLVQQIKIQLAVL